VCGAARERFVMTRGGYPRAIPRARVSFAGGGRKPSRLATASTIAALIGTTSTNATRPPPKIPPVQRCGPAIVE
jgi:hypothetical protein